MQTVMYASPSKSDRCIGICCTGLDPALTLHNRWFLGTGSKILYHVFNVLSYKSTLTCHVRWPSLWGMQSVNSSSSSNQNQLIYSLTKNWSQGRFHCCFWTNKCWTNLLDKFICDHPYSNFFYSRPMRAATISACRRENIWRPRSGSSRSFPVCMACRPKLLLRWETNNESNAGDWDRRSVVMLKGHVTTLASMYTTIYLASIK